MDNLILGILIFLSCLYLAWSFKKKFFPTKKIKDKKAKSCASSSSSNGCGGPCGCS